ncbi:MAG: hypothetical protein AAB971_02365 [Patescibacteria group bacterium]
MRDRVAERIDRRNAASYRALVATHETAKRLRDLDWLLSDTLDS